MARLPPLLSSWRKRPCAHCRKWFLPEARVGERQRFCREPACQQVRDRRQKAAWRRANPTYFRARRWDRAVAKEPPTVPQAPPPLHEVPWAVVQTQLEAQPAVILALLVGLLRRRGKTQSRGYPPGFPNGSARHPPPGAPTQMAAAPPDPVSAGSWKPPPS